MHKITKSGRISGPLDFATADEASAWIEKNANQVKKVDRHQFVISGPEYYYHERI